MGRETRCGTGAAAVSSAVGSVFGAILPLDASKTGAVSILLELLTLRGLRRLMRRRRCAVLERDGCLIGMGFGARWQWRMMG